jgi:NhaP-type Na+/H+ or K+/H+ antiporter
MSGSLPSSSCSSFLPALVFPAAVHLDAALLWRNLGPVFLLAGPGLLVTTAVVGGVVAALTPLPGALPCFSGR